MKKMLSLIIQLGCLLGGAAVNAQAPVENLILVTTDGLRWQEVFGGMDPELAKEKAFVKGDSARIHNAFWAEDPLERRRKLLPFFWSALAEKGQLYGNRNLGNKVNTANTYWFSYPGYNEILTGFPDEKVNSNDYPANPNVTVLEFLNKQPAFKNKVAVFAAWAAFDRIVNEQRSGIPVVNAFDLIGGNRPTSNEILLNKINREGYRPFHDQECLDVITHYSAMETLKNRKPKVLQISYGETDEAAHEGNYYHYLAAAHQVDQWIADIWAFVQSDPHYRNKTAILITTDHGRGDKVKAEWTSHGSKIAGADEIWIAVLGPGIPAKGELKTTGQLYQMQVAQTIAKLLGQTYQAGHPVASEIKEIWGN